MSSNLRNVASRLVGQIIANAGVPNAATYSRTSEKPSARTAFRHGERAPDYAQPVNARETKYPDIRKNQRVLSVFSYPMLSRRYRLSGFSDSAALRKSRTRMGCGPLTEARGLQGPAVPGATFIKGTMTKLTTVPPAQHGAA